MMVICGSVAGGDEVGSIDPDVSANLLGNAVAVLSPTPTDTGI
jgi:hypothetical protein